MEILIGLAIVVLLLVLGAPLLGLMFGLFQPQGWKEADAARRAAEAEHQENLRVIAAAEAERIRGDQRGE